MNDNEVIEFGKLAFEGYCFSTGNKTHDNKKIPKWEDLPVKIQEAWCVSANVVINEYVQKTLTKIKTMSEAIAKDSAEKHFAGIDISKLIPDELK